MFIKKIHSIAVIFTTNVICSYIICSTAYALSPAEVLVVVNENLPASKELGKLYLESRKIPAENFISVKLPVEETIERKIYNESLLVPLRTFLESGENAPKIKSIVLMYGVPLRVLGPTNEAPQGEVKALELRVTEALKTLRNLNAMFSNIDVTKQAVPEISEQELPEILSKSMLASFERLNKIEDPAIKKAASERLISIIAAVGGGRAVLQNLKPEVGNKDGEAQIAKLQSQFQNSVQLLQGLTALNQPKTRNSEFEIIKEVLGNIGVVVRAKEILAQLANKDTDASVDSELSLLWWNEIEGLKITPTYLLSSRMPNPGYYKMPRREEAIPTLIVARIDASSAELAKKMIENTAPDKKLTGKFFVDSRTLNADQGEIYQLYDQDLLKLSSLVKKIEVVEDKTPELFKEATDVALYAGWYKLRDYQNIFKFNPGSFGYHIASEEAVSLKNPTEKGWCKGAIDNGISGCIGSIGEPYLDSFPLPSEFFSLFLSGNRTLGEAYNLTTRFASWRMVLIGDPLYNPYKSSPGIEDAAIPNELKTAVIPFVDPKSSLKKFIEKRSAAITESALLVKLYQEQREKAKQVEISK